MVAKKMTQEGGAAPQGASPQGNAQPAGMTQGPQMSREEEIGYHKGAINTLVNERNELLRMVQIVDTFIQGHAKRLEELGVKLQQPQGQ